MKELYKALASFQQEVPIIHKATQGHTYTYASLDSIIKTINPVMKKHNLGFTQLLDNDTIITHVFHTETGEFLQSSVTIPSGYAMKGMNVFQSMGSAITYLKRYSLGSMLGLITDKDIDASGEQRQENGIKHHAVDPFAEDNELHRQLISAIMIEGHTSGDMVQADELQNESNDSLKVILAEFTQVANGVKAKKWIDDQMTKPRKSGTIDALKKLKAEASSRGFLDAYVIGEMTKKFNELEEGAK